MSGIPGSVGGTPVQNVGAYGQEVSETIESVRAYDLETNRVVVLPEAACGFRYRISIFNTTERGRYHCADHLPAHAEHSQPEVRGPAKTGRSRGSRHLAQVRAAVLQIRLSKGMLIVPGDADGRSTGSFFKNPVLSETEFHDLASRAELKGLKIPSYPALDAQRKVSAAWLVEHSGFVKGFTLGAAGISRKHALALINTGSASAADIVRLKEKILRGVEEAWGIVLEPEPVFVGF